MLGFLRRPEPWPWLFTSAIAAVAGAAARAYSWSWEIVLGIAVLLAISVAFFVVGSRLRLRGLHQLEQSDSEGAFDQDAAKGILDLRIVILIEAAVVGSTVGALAVPFEYLTLLVEVVVLTFTAALVYLTAVYASASLSSNTSRMIAEHRTTSVSSSAAIVEAIRTVKESNEAGSRLVASEVASLRGDARDAEERRRVRERELSESARALAEQERLAVRPNLDGRLEIVGGPLHNVMLTIANSGMDAFNLTVRIEGRFSPNQAIPIGRIGRGQSIRLSLGDVGKFPWDRVVPVVVRCSGFDVAGRPAEYIWQFEYLRSTGLFGVTTSWNIRRVS